DALGARDAAGLNHTVKLSLSRSLEHQVRWYLIRPRRTPPIPRAGAAAIRRLADLTIHGVLQVRPWPQSPSPPPSPRFILTGAVGANGRRVATPRRMSRPLAMAKPPARLRSARSSVGTSTHFLAGLRVR